MTSFYFALDIGEAAGEGEKQKEYEAPLTYGVDLSRINAGGFAQPRAHAGGGDWALTGAGS